MVSYPPGWKRPPELDRVVRRNQSVMGTLCAGTLEKQEEEIERAAEEAKFPKPEIEHWKRPLRGKRRRRRKGEHIWVIRRDPKTQRFISRKRFEVPGVGFAKNLPKPSKMKDPGV